MRPATCSLRAVSCLAASSGASGHTTSHRQQPLQPTDHLCRSEHTSRSRRAGARGSSSLPALDSVGTAAASPRSPHGPPPKHRAMPHCQLPWGTQRGGRRRQRRQWIWRRADDEGTGRSAGAAEPETLPLLAAVLAAGWLLVLPRMGVARRVK